LCINGLFGNTVGFFCHKGTEVNGKSNKKEAVSKVNFAAASYFMECYIFD
jgi:hypothetical protein